MNIVKYSVCSCLVAFTLAGCGGGGSPTVTTNIPVPKISGISPNSVIANDQEFNLVVSGSNFNNQSSVLWNGDALFTTYISQTQLQASVPGNDVAVGGTAEISVVSPGPISSGISSSLTITINNPQPIIASITPASVQAGSGSFTLTVAANNSVSTSVVEWNGSPLPTTNTLGDLLQAEVPATDVATLQTATVSVVSPKPGGGKSEVLFTVDVVVNQPVHDIAWDATNQVLYASVPGDAATNANEILVLDPNTGSVLSSQITGSNPDVLAISDDDQFLYVGLDGASSIQRFILPSLTPNISWGLGSGNCGPYLALDIEVAPGDPHTTAVSSGCTGGSPLARGGIAIYDDSTARPAVATYAPKGYLFDSLQWGPNASTLFAADTESSGGDLYLLSVDSNGVTLNQDIPSLVGSRIHFDSGTDDIYADAGQVIGANGITVGQFYPSGIGPYVMVPDSSVDRAFFAYQATTGSLGLPVEAFNLRTFQPIDTLTISNANSEYAEYVSKIIRWGPDGLALIISKVNGEGLAIVLLKGQFVSG